MPVYTIYHRSNIARDARKATAESLTSIHCELTGAQPDTVKVMFLELDIPDLFIGGKTVRDYVRVIGQIREGRADEVMKQIMQRTYATLRAVVPTGEIQVQLIEIDDTKTVMTNGALNAVSSNRWNMSSETLV
jgi:phenylpyruvate tautomerase PptA (4-oxalocrotonate tautomerase family)